MHRMFAVFQYIIHMIEEPKNMELNLIKLRPVH